MGRGQLVGLEPETPTVAVTADGVLRAPLYAGELTASMAFDVLSMGVGEDGSAGFPWCPAISPERAAGGG